MSKAEYRLRFFPTGGQLPATVTQRCELSLFYFKESMATLKIFVDEENGRQRRKTADRDYTAAGEDGAVEMLKEESQWRLLPVRCSGRN